MKLIGSLASPYVRKVRVVMLEKKLDFGLAPTVQRDGLQCLLRRGGRAGRPRIDLRYQRQDGGDVAHGKTVPMM